MAASGFNGILREERGPQIVGTVYKNRAPQRLTIEEQRILSTALRSRTSVVAKGRCPLCNSCGWICDTADHPTKPWADQPGSGPNACGCGAGKPCPDCNELSKERGATPR